MKIFQQGDPRWANIILGYGTRTIGDVGCTLTDLSMITGIRPDVLNQMLKGNSYKESAFAGTSRNLINWTKLEKLTNGLIKFVWRGYGYDEAKIKAAISNNGFCLVEVDFDGTGPRDDRHWIVAKGDKKANDPWTGNEIPTNKYPIWTGWAELIVTNQGGDMAEKTELEVCQTDRKKFWDERDALHRALEAENQSDALKEIKRLKEFESQWKGHKCPENNPITDDKDKNFGVETGTQAEFDKNGVLLGYKKTYKPE